MKQFDAWRLDTLNQCLWHDGVAVNLSPKPYAVLAYLVEHPERLITQSEFMEALWPGTYVQPQVLRTYVLELRRVLGDDAANPRFIATAPKRGYRFLMAVAEVAESAGRDQGKPGRRVEDGIAAPAAEVAEEAAGRLVGRSQELETLRSSMERAAAGERQVIFVSAEPGMGKTALVDAFCAEVCGDEGAGVRVARSQCVERFGGGPGYFVGPELLRELSGFSQSAEVGRLATGLTSGGAELSAGELCEVVEAAAQDEPLLLVIEDLQWGDGASLDFCSLLARRRTAAKVMLIATCRPAVRSAVEASAEAFSAGEVREDGGRRGVQGLRGLKQDLSRRRLCRVVPLEELDGPSVDEFVSRELRRRGCGAGLDGEGAESAPARELMEFLRQRSGGHPLFLRALLEDLLARKFIVAVDGGWKLRRALTVEDVGVPEALREMIEVEIEAMDGADQRLLEAASVAASLMGCVFPVWAAAAVLSADAGFAGAGVGGTGSGGMEFEEQYEALARRVHFIRHAGHDELPDGARSGSYVFLHSFYREVCYERQPEVRRSRSHQRVAERLGTLFAGDEESVAAEIASRYEAAGNWKLAAQTVAKMAAGCEERRQDDVAAGLLNRALELVGNLGAKERASLEAELRGRLAALSQSGNGRRSAAVAAELAAR